MNKPISSKAEQLDEVDQEARNVLREKWEGMVHSDADFMETIKERSRTENANGAGI